MLIVESQSLTLPQLCTYNVLLETNIDMCIDGCWIVDLIRFYKLLTWWRAYGLHKIEVDQTLKVLNYFR